MLFDSDIIIWHLKGNAKASKLIEKHPSKKFSIQSYMEILQGARNREEFKVIRRYLQEANFQLVLINEEISRRASFLIEEYALSHGMRVGDALIAATCLQNAEPLVTANAKDFRFLKELELLVFRPH